MRKTRASACGARPSARLVHRQLRIAARQANLTVEERGSGDDLAVPAFQRLAQVPHHEDDLALFEADIEKIEREREAENIDRRVRNVDTGPLDHRPAEREVGRGCAVKFAAIEGPINVEQALDAGLEDRRRPIGHAPPQRECAPQRPFHLAAFVGRIVHSHSSSNK